MIAFQDAERVSAPRIATPATNQPSETNRFTAFVCLETMSPFLAAEGWVLPEMNGYCALVSEGDSLPHPALASRGAARYRLSKVEPAARTWRRSGVGPCGAGESGHKGMRGIEEAQRK